MDERGGMHQNIYLNYLKGKHSIPILTLHPPLQHGAWRLHNEERLYYVWRGSLAGSSLLLPFLLSALLRHHLGPPQR